MGELFSIPILDLEAEVASAAAYWEEIRAMAGHDHPERFCPISLGDWLSICQMAGVRHVPARKVTELIRDDYLAFEQREGEHHERLQAAEQAIMAAVRDGGHMMRLDCCSGDEIKYRMSIGEPECLPGFQEIVIGDIRAYDIVFEYPRDTVPVWQRPWVRPMLELGYPVEYRAYVRDGEIQGISNYYPQRPLPEYPGHLEAVREMTERLIEHVQPPFLWHTTGMLDGTPLDLARAQFTADFLVSEYGEVLWLEGGPPHELGAHPCCFRPGEIAGIALVNRNQEEEEKW